MAELSVYQILHTMQGRAYHTEEHLELLQSSYHAFFGSKPSLNVSQVKAQIQSVVERSRCPRSISLFIVVRLTESGECSVEEYQRSMYSGYALRCIAPRIAVVPFDIPHIEVSSSIRDTITQYANAQAKIAGADIALRQHGDKIDLINGAQIFAVAGSTIITAPKSLSIEHAIVKEIVEFSPHFALEEREIGDKELFTFDELFLADHNGITAIKSYRSHFYTSTTASTIAQRMLDSMRWAR